MKLDRRITNGLAWAGVILVVGVPTADLLSAQFSGDATPARVAAIEPAAPVPAPLSQRPDAPSSEVAEVKPVAPVASKPATQPVAQTASVVDNFVNSGKPLPSYITGGDAAAAPAVAPVPAPAQVATTPPVRTPILTTPAAVDPTQVAALAPQRVAPVPMPLSMRPTPITVPVAVTAPADIVIPSGIETPRPSATVTAADLDDWETGPLSEFLARKQGQGGGSSATVTTDYDPDGFYLDQGPNPRERDRVIVWEEQPFSFFAD